MEGDHNRAPRLPDLGWLTLPLNPIPPQGISPRNGERSYVMDLGFLHSISLGEAGLASRKFF
jgi:hypothetical protein